MNHQRGMGLFAVQMVRMCASEVIVNQSSPCKAHTASFAVKLRRSSVPEFILSSNVRSLRAREPQRRAYLSNSKFLTIRIKITNITIHTQENTNHDT